MKKIIKYLIFSMAIMAVALTANAQAPKSDQVTVCFKTNMDCIDCEAPLNNYLKFEKGIKDLKVDFQTNTIKVVYKTGKNTPENLVKGIKKQGYEANVITEEQYKLIWKDVKKK